MNEVAMALGFRALAPGCDCHSWIDVEIGETGALLDACGACGESVADHPPDAFPDSEDEDRDD